MPWIGLGVPQPGECYWVRSPVSTLHNLPVGILKRVALTHYLLLHDMFLNHLWINVPAQ